MTRKKLRASKKLGYGGEKLFQRLSRKREGMNDSVLGGGLGGGVES